MRHLASALCSTAAFAGLLGASRGATAAGEPLPVARHIGHFGPRLPGNCPTTGGNSLNDSPFIGNAGLGKGCYFLVFVQLF
eukprot:SAG31_NODE_17539_length_666_cov_0.922535_1_plen_80_part_10